MPQIGTSGNIYENTFLDDLGSGVGLWDRMSMFGSAWLPSSGANTANAAVTGILSAFSTLGNALSARSVYNMYKQQEQLYIQNAMEQARRIQIKGDIALRNLEIEHATERGKNQLGAAAGGGRLSGSTLDVLVQNHKYNMMDERTSSLQTLWEVDNAKRSGYVQAINTAGQAMTLAYSNRASALNAFSAFVRGMSQGLLKDKRQELENNYRQQALDIKLNGIEDSMWNYYGRYGLGTGLTYNTGQAVDSNASGTQQAGITSSLVNTQGTSYADPATGLSVNTSGNSGLLPLIQLNEDGSLKTNYDPLKISQ